MTKKIIRIELNDNALGACVFFALAIILVGIFGSC